MGLTKIEKYLSISSRTLSTTATPTGRYTMLNTLDTVNEIRCRDGETHVLIASAIGTLRFQEEAPHLYFEGASNAFNGLRNVQINLKDPMFDLIINSSDRTLDLIVWSETKIELRHPLGGLPEIVTDEFCDAVHRCNERFASWQ